MGNVNTNDLHFIRSPFHQNPDLPSQNQQAQQPGIPQHYLDDLNQPGSGLQQQQANQFDANALSTVDGMTILNKMFQNCFETNSRFFKAHLSITNLSVSLIKPQVGFFKKMMMGTKNNTLENSTIVIQYTIRPPSNLDESADEDDMMENELVVIRQFDTIQQYVDLSLPLITLMDEIGELNQKLKPVFKRRKSINQEAQALSLSQEERKEDVQPEDQQNQQKLILDESSQDFNLCEICFERQIDVALPCKHAFCKPCIKAWTKKNLTCPLCRCDTKQVVDPEDALIEERDAVISRLIDSLIVILDDQSDSLKQALNKKNTYQQEMWQF